MNTTRRILTVQKFLGFIVIGLLTLSLLLAACGETPTNTASALPAATPTVPATTAATTAAPTTAVVTTAPAKTTAAATTPATSPTSAAGALPGMDVTVSPGLVLPPESTLPPGSIKEAPPAALNAARADLKKRETIAVDSDIVVVNSIEQVFSDTSLGCPSPDAMYAQVLTPGYQMTLEHKGKKFDYRVNARNNFVVLCSNGRPVTKP